jgi:hypothetical protein
MLALAPYLRLKRIRGQQPAVLGDNIFVARRIGDEKLNLAILNLRDLQQEIGVAKLCPNRRHLERTRFCAQREGGAQLGNATRGGGNGVPQAEPNGGPRR